MTPHIPWYITAVVLTIDAAIVTAVWNILSRAAARSGLPPAGQRAVRTGAAVFLGVWLGGLLLLAPAPATLEGRDPFTITPLIPLALALPLAGVALALAASASFRRTLAAVTVPALVGVQAYRIIGAVFLVLYAQGRIAGHFALPAGWGDVAVGLTAPLVALALARGVAGSRALAVSWIAFSLLDLAVAVGMGTGFLAPLLAPELGPRVAPVAAMGVFPLIMVPAFAVPISVMLHLAALVKLLGEARLARRVMPQTL